MKRIEAHRKCIEILNKIETLKLRIHSNVLFSHITLGNERSNYYGHRANIKQTYIDYLELKYQKLKYNL